MARPQPNSTDRHQRRREWVAFGVVFSLALLIRLAYLFEIASSPRFDFPLIDSETYDRLARQLTAGGGLTDEFFWQPVFYPLFLSGIYALTGGSALAARLLQIALGALTCGLVYRLGRETCDRRTSLAAGLFAALCGPLVFFDGELLATGWAAFWSVALLLMLCRMGRGGKHLDSVGPLTRWRILARSAGLGLCMALATITRPTFLPFLVAATIWLALRWRARGTGNSTLIAGQSGLLIGFLVVVLPVAFMNGRVTGRTSFLPASAGINLSIGNNPERARTVNIRPGWEWERLTRSPRLHGVTEKKDTSRYFRGQVLEYARSDPTGFAGGLLAKSGEMISSRELPRNLDIYVLRDASATLSALVWKVARFGFPVGLLLPLAVLGLILQRSKLPTPLLFFLLLYAAAVVLVFVSSRYRTPILAPLCLPAAAGANGLLDALREGQRRELLGSTAILAITLLFCTVPGLFPQERGDLEAELHFLLGRRAEKSGEIQTAMRSQRRALALDPGNADANTALAYLLDKQGQTDLAIERYGTALGTRPDHAVALANLARIQAKRKEYPEAMRNLEAAIESTPLDTELYEDCATILAWQGRLDEALAYLDRALEIRADDSDLHYRKGRVLEALGQPVEALASLERSLQLDSLNREALDALAKLLVRGGRRDSAHSLYRAALERAQTAGREDLVAHIRSRLRMLELHGP